MIIAYLRSNIIINYDKGTVLRQAQQNITFLFFSELAPEVVTYYGNRSAAHMMLSAYDKALEDAQSAMKLDENFLKVSIDHIYCN